MKLFEYQAKELFREAGIEVPQSVLIDEQSDISAVMSGFPLPCVLKSQVLSGKRGKAGLIRFADSAGKALAEARSLFACGQSVKKILIEQAVSIAQELYLAITVDAAKAKALVISCAEGGMDIEELAANASEKIHYTFIDLLAGALDFQCRGIAYELGFGGDTAKQVAAVVKKLYGVFSKYDAELAEINPLFITKEGGVIAGDGKLVIDDNSVFRQKHFEIGRDYFSSDAEYESHLEGIPYLQFDGDISLMCAGAGLTTTVFDLINYSGGTVANYLEFGGPNYKKAVRAMELCLKNLNAKVILIVTFGTIARADVMAEGIKSAIETLKPSVPIVTCIRGTNEEAADGILRSIGLNPLYDTEEAVALAVKIAKEAKA
jgi:succinyl-CoA synthetase beta subunit